MTRTTRSRRIAALVALVVAVALAVVPELLGMEAGGIAGHHLKHAVLILAGIIAGALASPARAADERREHVGWLAPAVLAPIAAMFTMWPTTYGYLEAHPPLHVLEHLVFVALAAVASYAGERYAKRMGWVVGVALVLMAIAATFGFGVILTSSS